MKVILQRTSKTFKPIPLQTTPTNYIQTVKQSAFKEGHPNFDVTTYNKTVKSIRNNKPVEPITLLVTEYGVPTQLDKVKGIYAAIGARDLGIKEIPVYVYVVNKQGHIIPKPKLPIYPKGFETPKLKPDVTKWSEYSWYRLKPISKKSIHVVDIKGRKFEIEPGTVYGAYDVKAGVRIVDADDTKIFFIVNPKRALKLIENSVKLRDCPLIIDTPKPAANIEKMVTTVDTSLEDIDPEQEFNTDEKERIIDVDYLQQFNDLDDLSLELYGHHLQEFDDGNYDDLDSLSKGSIYYQTSLSSNCGVDTNVSFGKVYARFFDTNTLAAKAKLDSRIAEENLIPIIRDLFTYLVSLNTSDVSVLVGTKFKKPLIESSASILKWIMLNDSTEIKHLVINVNGVILDPCFKRLGEAVRIDVYPVTEFKKLWQDVETIAIGTTPSSIKTSKLFKEREDELQIPLPTFNRSKEYSESRSKLSLKASKELVHESASC